MGKLVLGEPPRIDQHNDGRATAPRSGVLPITRCDSQEML
jgi:hypothetical protein